MKAKLQHTKDYDLFELHECNRDIHHNPVLETSMRKSGFKPSCAIHCIRNGEGKLKVIRGHHRLYYAKRLGLEVFYIIDDSDNNDIFDLEGAFSQTWTVTDFVIARAKADDKECSFLLQFCNKHHIPIGVGAAIVSGSSGASGSNKTNMIKRGTYKRGDMELANKVVRITDECRDLDIPFATSSGFVSALSQVLRVPQFDAETFCSRIRLYPKHMNRRGSIDEYLDEIEGLYNYRAREKRFPLKHEAQKIMRQRQKNFGN